MMMIMKVKGKIAKNQLPPPPSSLVTRRCCFWSSRCLSQRRKECPEIVSFYTRAEKIRLSLPQDWQNMKLGEGQEGEILVLLLPLSLMQPGDGRAHGAISCSPIQPPAKGRSTLCTILSFSCHPAPGSDCVSHSCYHFII